jgi:hypothetical protein
MSWRDWLPMTRGRAKRLADLAVRQEHHRGDFRVAKLKRDLVELRDEAERKHVEREQLKAEIASLKEK